MLPWAQEIDSLAEQSGFAGVVAVDRDGEIEFATACGLADRAHQVPNTLDTRFAIASGTKGLTALAVVSLISDGALHLSTTARSVLGADLPLIGDDVTVEHLLAHRSGIGDYLDEQDGHQITDYVRRCLRTSWPAPRPTWPCSAGTRPSSGRASGSATATADTWSWR